MNNRKFYYFISLLFLFNVVNATEQRIGDFEIAIDAPWRMEPNNKKLALCQGDCTVNQAYEYGSIPINIAILDAFLPDSNIENSVLLHKLLQGYERNDYTISSLFYKMLKEYAKIGANPGKILTPDELGFLSDYEKTNLQQFSSLTVFEEINGQFRQRASYSINDLHEVELTVGFWQWAAPNQAPPARPNHVLCRRWNGDNCTLSSKLSDTSEWHAIAMYEPADKTPGHNVKLKLVLSLKATVDDRLRDITFDQYVNVHLGEAPLPKFNQNWYYGDLHYHSQGTDNDGESGYSYRSALQAMSAIGLDFALASDHASNSQQIISISFSPLGSVETNLLRDLSPDRFSSNIQMVNGIGGANQEVSSYPRVDSFFAKPAINELSSVHSQGLAVPQLFLGAEVDVIPEIKMNVNMPHIQDIFASCKNLPPIMIYLQNGMINSIIDKGKDIFSPTSDTEDGVCGDDNLLDPTSDGRLLIRDIQGPHLGDYVSKNFYARQHLLHFPEDPLRTDSFIASNSSKYGGATRRLKDILNTEFTQPNGVLFLAHPLSTASGSDVDRLGPDIAPYSEASLLDAFAAQQVLGLQLWNENTHHKTTMQNNSAREPAQIQDILENSEDLNQAVSYRPNFKLSQKGKFIPVSQLTTWKHEKQPDKSANGISMWDTMLMWGLDPAYTSDINWLPKGQPRRIFIAGGSDAHGDYNYRREGYFVGMQQVTDTTIGSPRNLIFAGPPQGTTIKKGDLSGTPVSQKQIVEAFKQGNFVVTDGPIIRIAYDMNRNGKIDRQDKQMGSVVSPEQCNLPILVEWKSTAEFGPVNTIDLNIGSFSDAHQDGWIYQPWRGNQHVPKPSDAEDYTTFTEERSGKTLTLAHLSSPFGWRGKYRQHLYDPSNGFDMAINVHSSEKFGGIRQININPMDYAVGKLKTTNICKQTQNKQPLIPFKTNSQSASSLSTNTKNTTLTNSAKIIDDNNGPQKPVGEIDEFAPPPPAITIDPACIINAVNELKRPDRMYIRAKLIGEINGLLPRKAYTNPIWFNLKNKNILRCSIGPDELILDNSKTCNTEQHKICRNKGASCEVLTTSNNKHDEICRWDDKKSQKQCIVNGGIWTTINSKFAKNHPASIPEGQKSACLTQVENLTCNSADINTCQNFSASCDIIHSKGGVKHSVCRWPNDKSASLCKKTLGIWTTTASKYGRNNPNAIIPGDSGACISDIKNLKNRIR